MSSPVDQHRHLIGVVSDVRVEQYNVRCGNPNTVQNADQKAMQKILTAALLGNRVRADDKNYQPTKRLDGGRNKIDSGNTHRQSEERQFEDEISIHSLLFIKVIKILAVAVADFNFLGFLD
jgi:hypothetical protein